ncbi:MAG: Mrp/NBP35 family ATP-binding protein [Oscillatoria sp. SIO1A7]|nr:Mrp/NBP35 family ATP-binding protein [Oscillatoria sp. SIO1A7]
MYGSAGGENAAKTLEAPLLGCVPLEIDVRVSGDGGEPIVLAQPESPSAQSLSAIAQQIVMQVVETSDR